MRCLNWKKKSNFFATQQGCDRTFCYSHPYTLFPQMRMTNESFIKGMKFLFVCVKWILWCACLCVRDGTRSLFRGFHSTIYGPKCETVYLCFMCICCCSHFLMRRIFISYCCWVFVLYDRHVMRMCVRHLSACATVTVSYRKRWIGTQCFCSVFFWHHVKQKWQSSDPANKQFWYSAH